MPKTYGPYASYQVSGNLVFSAGQVGAKDGKAPENITDQTRLALQNLADVLKQAGSDLSKVVKVTVYLVNIEEFEAMNKVYAEVFEASGSRPARSTVSVKELPRVADNKLLVEVEAVAEKL